MQISKRSRWISLVALALVALAAMVLRVHAPDRLPDREAPGRTLRGEPPEARAAADRTSLPAGTDSTRPSRETATRPANERPPENASGDVQRLRGVVVGALDAARAARARIHLSEGFPERHLFAGFGGARRARSLASAPLDGRLEFEFIVAGGGPFTVALDHPDVVAVPATNVEPGDRVVLRAMASASLAGRVLSRTGGAAVEGAEVRLFVDGEANARIATTGPDGIFAFTGLAPGEAGVFALAAGKRKGPWTELVLEPGPNEGPELVLDEGRSIRGVVRDARTNAPIPGAEVSTWSFFGRCVVTDHQGRFLAWGAGRTGGEVVARAPGYGAGRAAFGAEDREVDVVLRREIPVRGVVLGPDGRPAGDARVAVRSRWRNGDVAFEVGRVEGPEEDGTFLVSGVSNALEVVAWGADGAAGPIAVDPGALPRAAGGGEVRDMGAVQLAPPAPEPDEAPSSAPGAPVTGTVRGEGGRPLEGARVSLGTRGWSRSAITDDAGRFLIDGAPPRPLDLDVRGPDPGTHLPSRRAGIQAGDDVAVRLTPTGATASGSVVSVDGQPLRDVYVAVIGDGGVHARPVLTGPDGSFSLAVPASGAVELGAWRTRPFGPDEVDVTRFEHLSARRVVGLGGPPAARIEVDGGAEGVVLTLP